MNAMNRDRKAARQILGLKLDKFLNRQESRKALSVQRI
jgi:hypothetical protein